MAVSLPSVSSLAALTSYSESSIQIGSPSPRFRTTVSSAIVAPFLRTFLVGEAVGYSCRALVAHPAGRNLARGDPGRSTSDSRSGGTGCQGTAHDVSHGGPLP